MLLLILLTLLHLGKNKKVPFFSPLKLSFSTMEILAV